MELSLDIRLRLSAQRALLGNVPPALRSVSLDADEAGKTVFVRYVFEREPSASEREAVLDAAGEIIADFTWDWKLKEQVSVIPFRNRWNVCACSSITAARMNG